MVERLGLVITFIILNCIVVVYAFFLIIYGKYYKKNDFLFLANLGDNAKAIPRIEESIRAPNDEHTHADDKTIQLIET